ncbi:hypothetical protein [Actinoallomurus soli]|uniref:hypothetical protein n=1 Tax=Actinoallomurus soli TaxID=2952535 RepID=UPI0020931792|nr:hypothetical protein [Actinoallomurus soli]MCO5968513.1 hypothetical protein [Actinoallomurus soli]
MPAPERGAADERDDHRFAPILRDEDENLATDEDRADRAAGPSEVRHRPTWN